MTASARWARSSLADRLRPASAIIVGQKPCHKGSGDPRWEWRQDVFALDCEWCEQHRIPSVLVAAEIDCVPALTRQLAILMRHYPTCSGQMRAVNSRVSIDFRTIVWDNGSGARRPCRHTVLGLRTGHASVATLS